MAVSHIKGENVFNTTGEDLVNLARGVGSFNKAWQVQTALHSMEWLSRNEKLMAKGVSPAMAYFMGITGLQPWKFLRTASTIMHSKVKNKWRRLQSKDTFLNGKEVRSLTQSVPDPVAATQHFRNADATLTFYKYPQARRDTLFAKANDRQTLPDKELGSIGLVVKIFLQGMNI